MIIVFTTDGSILYPTSNTYPYGKLDIAHIIVSERDLVRVKEQFRNIPFNEYAKDSHIWFGDIAKTIVINYIWEDK